MSTDSQVFQQLIQGETGLGESDDTAWMEVIQKMDEAYTGLIQYQIELEEKNIALEKAQAFIEGILTSMSDILIVCDLKGQILQSNLALEQLTGIEEKTLIGTSLAELFADGSSSTISIFKTNLSKKVAEEYEVSIKTKDALASPLMIRCSPQIDHDGILVGMVLIGRPVGELRQAYKDLNQAHIDLKQTQKQLVQSEKMASLGRLVAGVAHELNNPISFIHSNTFILEKYGHRLREYIDALHQQLGDQQDLALRKQLKIDRVLDDIPSLVAAGLEGTERVTKIVQDLKRFSTEEREQASFFNITKIVEKAIGWVSSSNKSSQVQVNFHGEDIIVKSYEGYIHQVVVNLIQNGLDAMENCPSPIFDIDCRIEHGQAVVEIRDHGTGIPEENLIGIFDAFYTTKDVGKGTGLGLYISFGLIVEQCGGEMTALNHPDGGAIFRFSIPMNEGD